MIIISEIENAHSPLVWSIALWHRLVEEILFVLDSPPFSRGSQVEDILEAVTAEVRNRRNIKVRRNGYN